MKVNIKILQSLLIGLKKGSNKQTFLHAQILTSKMWRSKFSELKKEKYNRSPTNEWIVWEISYSFLLEGANLLSEGLCIVCFKKYKRIRTKTETLSL